ncbi:SagB/ThcOx family dehydrogenase [Halomonas elongata]|uniref:SagB/ThcOx family dehydrogenase n=1 Tax=Halomonas elongata TaxID=2746 RepID=UPI0023B11079|nr:SagB/ThcOx family dehydrogenase [Halomonas elongata]
MADITLTQALSRRRTIREFTNAAVSPEVLKRLAWAAQGITDTEGKRTAPSAHAIHPLQLFVVANRVDGLDQGVYEVDSLDSGLRMVNRADVRPALRRAAIGAPQWIADAAFIVAICADMVTPSRAFAEQKPYGERGVRYVYMEAGAAAQNLQLQAVAEGLGSVWVGGFNDEETANLLDLQTPLTPIILLCVGYPA